MNLYNQTYQDLVAAYFAIEPTEYRERVRFFDEHRSDIERLQFEDKFLLELDYSMNLFEIGWYQKFLDRVDELIETVVIDNIELQGREIYYDLLFRKAASLYNVDEIAKSHFVASQLYKIASNYPGVDHLCYQCERRKHTKFYEVVKAISVGLFLVGFALAFMDMLLVRSFYEGYIPLVNMLKNVIFVAAIVTLLANELGMVLYARWKVKSQLN